VVKIASAVKNHALNAFFGGTGGDQFTYLTGGVFVASGLTFRFSLKIFVE
jgi:hypothetical protein